MRPFCRDWLPLAMRISLLTEPPHNANGAALNRVREDREAVTKPELGTKRLCAHCSAKFYDLNQAPITCPKCGVVFEGVQGRSRSRTEARAPLREIAPLVPETHEAEFVSLEDAEAEAEGKKEPSEAVEAGDEVELDDERGDDEEFVEDSEEEDTDVAAVPDRAARRCRIISSSAISNLIPMSPVLLVSPEDPAISVLAPYFRQAPDRGLRSGAEETVPQE
jgi:uncharacterized protein (TIGR02300 family)